MNRGSARATDSLLRQQCVCSYSLLHPLGHLGGSGRRRGLTSDARECWFALVANELSIYRSISLSSLGRTQPTWRFNTARLPIGDSVTRPTRAGVRGRGNKVRIAPHIPHTRSPKPTTLILETRAGAVWADQKASERRHATRPCTLSPETRAGARGQTGGPHTPYPTP